MDTQRKKVTSVDTPTLVSHSHAPCAALWKDSEGGVATRDYTHLYVILHVYI